MGSCNPQPLRSFSNTDPLKIIPQNLPWMCRIEDQVSSELVIVLIVHQDSILSLKSECQAPVATHSYRPMPCQIAFQRIKVVPRCIHVIRATCDIKCCEQRSQSFAMLGLDSGLGPVLGKFLESLVPVAHDHAYSV